MNYEFRQRYVFVELLGRGGMGAVFRAYDRQSPANPWVAIKVAQLRGGAQHQELLKSIFAREAAAASSFQENTAFFVGCRGVDYNDPAYIALEFVPWPTLKQYRQKTEKLPPVHVAQIGIKILQGLRCMERRRWVHRDLKPENLFVLHQEETDTFEVKIADLGIWVEAGEPDTLLSIPDALRHAGTVSYMSPEQSRGEPVTTASDLHMLGSVLWELATGAVPFPAQRGHRSSEEAVNERLARLRTLPARPPNMPHALYEILTTALAFEPQHRAFADMRATSPTEMFVSREMEKALQRFADEYPEQRRQQLEQAFKALDLAAGRLAEIDGRLRRFETLSARKDALRARVQVLRDEAAEPEILGDSVKVLVQDIDAFTSETHRDLFDPELRAQEASARAQVEAERADGLQHRLDKLHKAMDLIAQRAVEAKARADAAEARGAILQQERDDHARRASDAERRVEAEAARASEAETRAAADAERAAQAETQRKAEADQAASAEKQAEALRLALKDQRRRFVLSVALGVAGICGVILYGILHRATPAEASASPRSTATSDAPPTLLAPEDAPLGPAPSAPSTVEERSPSVDSQPNASSGEPAPAAPPSPSDSAGSQPTTPGPTSSPPAAVPSTKSTPTRPAEPALTGPGPATPHVPPPANSAGAPDKGLPSGAPCRIHRQCASGSCRDDKTCQ